MWLEAPEPDWFPRTKLSPPSQFLIYFGAFLACGGMYRLVIAYHIIVSGFVQGVGFRWFTQRLAESLGVGGWVRNLPDGRVEVFAQAEKDVLDVFCGKLREGPSYGQTEGLAIEKVPVDHKILGFRIRH